MPNKKLFLDLALEHKLMGNRLGNTIKDVEGENTEPSTRKHLPNTGFAI